MKYIVTPVTTFCFIFILFYLMSSSVVWVFYKTTLSGTVGLYWSVSRYAQAHRQELATNVFGSTFNEARRCSVLPDGGEKDACISGVKVMLGDSVIEEELSGRDGYMWPNDLFFVKQENGTFYRFRWDGKIQEIALGDVPIQKQHVALLLFQQSCNHFRSEQANMGYACEIYAEVPLSGENKGYMVRIDSSTEEDHFLFILISPMLLLPFYVSNINSTMLFYIFVALIQVVVPSVAALIFVAMLHKTGFFRYEPDAPPGDREGMGGNTDLDEDLSNADAADRRILSKVERALGDVR